MCSVSMWTGAWLLQVLAVEPALEGHRQLATVRLQRSEQTVSVRCSHLGERWEAAGRPGPGGGAQQDRARRDSKEARREKEAKRERGEQSFTDMSKVLAWACRAESCTTPYALVWSTLKVSARPCSHEMRFFSAACSSHPPPWIQVHDSLRCGPGGPLGGWATGRRWRCQHPCASVLCVVLQKHKRSTAAPREEAPWLASDIRVKLIDKALAGGALYLKKGTVLDVLQPRLCDVLVDGKRISNVHQSQLETVRPQRDLQTE